MKYDAPAFHRRFWQVPALQPVTVLACRNAGDAWSHLELAENDLAFCAGDDLWLADTQGRVSRMLVRQWSSRRAVAHVSIQYRESLTGRISVARRFCPSRSMHGFAPLLERFGGLPNLVDVPVAEFSVNDGSVVIGADGVVTYRMSGVEMVYLSQDSELGTIDAIEFADIDGRMAVMITGDSINAGLWCRSVSASLHDGDAALG